VRKALNENPAVQMIVLGVVGLIMVVMLFMTVLKKDPAPATEPAAPAATATAPATDTGAVPPATDPATGATAPATPPTTEPVTPPAGGGGKGGSNGLLPSKGLPKDVLVAYAKDKAIALLVVDPKGLADREVKGYTEALKSRNDVAVFVVKSKNVADYSRITSGVAVNRVPALVVVRPRKLTKAEPTASVSYGFRGPRSVDQAVDDALYTGKTLPSYP
jgi:hypothetical protein